MYGVVRRYKTKPGQSEEVARRAQEGFVPIISKLPGFVAYYGIVAGNDTIATVSVFQDRAGEEASTREAASWVASTLSGLLVGPPEVLAGQVGWSSLPTG